MHQLLLGLIIHDGGVFPVALARKPPDRRWRLRPALRPWRPPLTFLEPLRTPLSSPERLSDGAGDRGSCRSKSTAAPHAQLAAKMKGEKSARPRDNGAVEAGDEEEGLPAPCRPAPPSVAVVEPSDSPAPAALMAPPTAVTTPVELELDYHHKESCSED
jgi:hypothetical protein